MTAHKNPHAKIENISIKLSENRHKSTKNVVKKSIMTQPPSNLFSFRNNL